MSILDFAKSAKAACIELSIIDAGTKNKALKNIKSALLSNSEMIIQANKKDIENAVKQGLASPLLKRLKFDTSKIKDVCQGIDSLIDIDDPVGKTLSAMQLDDGLELYKVSCPIGVIGVVFESRPDALVQISTLCLKSSNAVMLKGGSEAANTNTALAQIINQAAVDAGLPDGWMQLLQSREDVAEMLKCDDFIDLIIPRGSNEFVKYIMDNTTIPVLGHADGICHIFVDKSADIKMAEKVVIDSKCQYCAVCNALETLLVHKDIADKFIPQICKALADNSVEIFGCDATVKLVNVKKATEQDWKTEYLDLKLSIKIVDSIDDAIKHINQYGSGHTDAIITKDGVMAEKFMNMVDSADVFYNCSTRFADGFRFGLGAEVGISTNKIHARGPVGLEGLLIYKYKLVGSGDVVADYSIAGGKKFKHTKINKVFKV